MQENSHLICMQSPLVWLWQTQSVEVLKVLLLFCQCNQSHSEFQSSGKKRWLLCRKSVKSVEIENLEGRLYQSMEGMTQSSLFHRLNRDLSFLAMKMKLFFLSEVFICDYITRFWCTSVCLCLLKPCFSLVKESFL